MHVVSTSRIAGNIIRSDDCTVSNAVLLMYRHQFLANKCLLSLVVGLQRTNGLASIVNAMQSTAFKAAQ